MSPTEKHPRTQPGPRYPEADCGGTAPDVLGVSEAQAQADADAISATADDYYGDTEDVLD